MESNDDRELSEIICDEKVNKEWAKKNKGVRLSIYWTKRVKKPGWFYAKLGAWHQKKKKCNIHWEDGGNIWLNLNKHKFKLI